MYVFFVSFTDCEHSPKKIYLDLTSSTCDNEEFLYSVQANGVTNMAMHVTQKPGTNNNHSPLLTGKVVRI